MTDQQWFTTEKAMEAIMRLSKEQETCATNELLALLARNRQRGGHGIRTFLMCGTPAFHGESTLSLKQIARLLRKSGRAVAKSNRNPRFSYNVWKLTDEAWDQACDNRQPTPVRGHNSQHTFLDQEKTMCEKFSAVFEKRNGDIEVFYVHHCPEGNRKICIGTLDPAEEYGYEGKFVFNLAWTGSLHIPGNVLREIADYGAAPKEDLSGAARPKSKLRKRS